MDQAIEKSCEIKDSYEIYSIDWFLQDLVNMANKWGLEIGITLNIGGSLISGIIISGDKYFKEFALLFRSGFSNPKFENVGEKLEAYIFEYSKIYAFQEETEKNEKGKKESEDNKQKGPSFIHLSNARIYSHSGEPIPKNNSVLWRGKISSVDGFSLGKLEFIKGS
jgi:hypothetical protein